MLDWWNGLDTILKVLYCIAVPASLIFIIQTILSVAGGFSGGAGVEFTDTSGLDMGDFSTVVPEGGSDLGELLDGSDSVSWDGGNPADFSIGSMFTVQGIVTFLTVFGWTSIVGISSGSSPTLCCLVGVVLGVVAMYAVARLIFASRRLAENGTLDLGNAVGESGKVYIPIPARGTGEGKVNLCLQGRFVECTAISMEQEELRTGTSIRVVDARGDVLVVESEK